MSEAKVTLAHKKSIRDSEAEHKAALMARIKAATGVDYEFVIEPSVEEFALGVIKSGSRYASQLGPGIYNHDGYLSAFAKIMENNCKDSMVKEAIVEAISNKKLVLRLDDKRANEVEFKDGCFVFYTTGEYFYCAINNIVLVDLAKRL